MAEQHRSVIERIVHRVEDHIAQWRRQDAARKADANRDKLWAEAAERERLLAATIEHEEARQGSQEGAASGHQVVFVVASDAFADALEHFLRWAVEDWAPYSGRGWAASLPRS